VNPAEQSPAPDLRIVRGDPTPAEIGAVTAVIAAALEEASALEAPPVRSAWSRSQRNVRTPLQPGPGAWRSFSG
jgi:hypothetical protein